MSRQILTLKQGAIGILALFAFSPKTAKPLNELAEILLHDADNTLSRGEREFLAALVSNHNETEFCYKSHKAFSNCCLQHEGNTSLIPDMVFSEGLEQLPSERMKALAEIAIAVCDNSPQRTKKAADKALEMGIVTEKEVHDVALISAAFCMYNRYVRCLWTPLPENDEVYPLIAQDIYLNGYGSTTPKEELVDVVDQSL